MTQIRPRFSQLWIRKACEGTDRKWLYGGLCRHMRFAVVSDIHGNYPALKAVLADAEQHNVDAFLFLGDYCISAPYPNEVAYALRTAPSPHIVRGNEEDYFKRLEGQDPSTWRDGQMEITYWCYRTLTAENKRFLHSLPWRKDFICETIPLHMAHSSAVFMEDAEHAHFATRLIPSRYPQGVSSRATFLADVRETLARSATFQHALTRLSEGIYLFGHSHSQWHARFGSRLFINPGSCGLPLDFGDTGAPYTLLTVEQGGIEVEERRATYDVEQLISDMTQSEQYTSARVFTEIVIEELRMRHESLYFFLQYAETYAACIGDSARPFSKSTWEAAYRAWRDHQSAASAR